MTFADRDDAAPAMAGLLDLLLGASAAPPVAAPPSRTLQDSRSPSIAPSQPKPEPAPGPDVAPSPPAEPISTRRRFDRAARRALLAQPLSVPPPQRTEEPEPEPRLADRGTVGVESPRGEVQVGEAGTEAGTGSKTGSETGSKTGSGAEVGVGSGAAGGGFELVRVTPGAGTTEPIAPQPAPDRTEAAERALLQNFFGGALGGNAATDEDDSSDRGDLNDPMDNDGQRDDGLSTLQTLIVGSEMQQLQRRVGQLQQQTQALTEQAIAFEQRQQDLATTIAQQQADWEDRYQGLEQRTQDQGDRVSQLLNLMQTELGGLQESLGDKLEQLQTRIQADFAHSQTQIQQQIQQQIQNQVQGYLAAQIRASLEDLQTQLWHKLNDEFKADLQTHLQTQLQAQLKADLTAALTQSLQETLQTELDHHLYQTLYPKVAAALTQALNQRDIGHQQLSIRVTAIDPAPPSATPSPPQP